MISVHRKIEGVRNEVYRHVKKKVDVTRAWGIVYDGINIEKYRFIDGVIWEIEDQLDET